MVVAATGFFDGVHLGHRQIIDTLVRTARGRGGRSVLISFWPHPRTVLQKDARDLRLLSTLEEKKAIISDLGVDSVEILPFTRDFSRMTTQEYLRDIVVGRFDADAILLGYDNRMGFDSGSTDQIAAIAEGLGLEVIRMDAVSLPSAGVTVSSTKIRAALAVGDVELAAAMLGRRYSLHGVTVAGNRLGRTIGFPTANMQLYEPLKMLPANGCYLVEVETLGRHFHGMTNIGVRPTVTDGDSRPARTVETNIFDFSEEIYGLDLTLRFVCKIRDEKFFPSLDSLRAQLEQDRAWCVAKIK